MVEGSKPRLAFIEAASRMFWPIVSSTVVKIMVFLPLMFWPGIVGQFMKFMPITVIIILTNSLLFALLFQPSIGSFMSPYKDDPKKAERLKAAENIDLNNIIGPLKKYIVYLSFVLEHPKKFLVWSSLVLFMIPTFFVVSKIGVEFFPDVEPSSAVISVESAGNLSIYQKDAILKEIENRLLDMQDVKVFYSKSGKLGSGSSGNDDGIGVLNIELENWKNRRKATQIFSDIENRISDIKGIKYQILKAKKGPGGQKPIEINLSSQSYEKLYLYAATLTKKLEGLDGLRYIESSLSLPSIEWDIIFNRQEAAMYMVTRTADKELQYKRK